MDRSRPQHWLCDMDGVLVHEGVMVPGADRFIAALRSVGLRFLVLTNNSISTPRLPRDVPATRLGPVDPCLAKE